MLNVGYIFNFVGCSIFTRKYTQSKMDSRVHSDNVGVNISGHNCMNSNKTGNCFLTSDQGLTTYLTNFKSLAHFTLFNISVKTSGVLI